MQHIITLVLVSLAGWAWGRCVLALFTRCALGVRFWKLRKGRPMGLPAMPEMLQIKLFMGPLDGYTWWEPFDRDAEIKEYLDKPADPSRPPRLDVDQPMVRYRFDCATHNDLNRIYRFERYLDVDSSATDEKGA